MTAAAIPAFADNKAALTDRLVRAEASSSLDAPGVHPWHLKLEVQMYDEKGQPTPETGTVEEWWAAADSRRVVFALPGYKVTEVRDAKGLMRTRDGGSVPMLLQLLLDQILHPMPRTAEIDSSTPDLKKQSFGKVSLECIMLGIPMKSEVEAPLGLFPTYCFDPGKDSLRVSYNFGSEFIVRNRMGKFDSREVALDVMVNENGVHAASAKVVTLEGIAADSPDLTPQPAGPADSAPALVPASDKVTRLSGGVMAGTIIQKVQPIYPEGARRRHASGSVVLHAIIGRDGHVHSLHFVSLPDPDLGIAAVRAVRNWTYKPYTLNGQPTEVDTTITVNFNFGP